MTNQDYLIQNQCWRDVEKAMQRANKGQLSRQAATVLMNAYFDLIEGARREIHPTTPKTGI